MPKQGLKCMASGCTLDFCSEHKTEDFKCATPGCNNLVHGRTVYGGSAFLDDGYENRPIAGVLLDSTVNQRPSCEIVETVEVDPNDGQAKRILKRIPRVGAENHAYLCQTCSLKIKEVPEKRAGAYSRYANILRHNVAKHVTVPLEMRRTTINGQVVEIRVLGPGLLPDDEEMLKKVREHVRGLMMSGSNVAHTQLPVKIFKDEQLHKTGIEKATDTATYRAILGLTIDGILRGQCELTLPANLVRHQNKTLIHSIYIQNLVLETNFRGQGIGSFFMSYILYFIRFLKTEFNTDFEYVRMNTYPHNHAANAIALKNGFFCLGDPSATNDVYQWYYLLRTSHEEAIAFNKKERFLQYLHLPVVVKYKRDLLFGFIYNFQNHLHASTHILELPSTPQHVMDNETMAVCKISDYLMSQNKCPFTDEWTQEQAAFYLSLSEEEHITILTYSFRGDQMANRFMQYGTVHGAHCIRVEDREAQWYCHTIDAFQYILFQTQLRKVYGEEFTVRNAADVNRITNIIRTWHTDIWTPVMEQYVRDLHDLYDRAPALKFPMVSYRGEQAGHIYGTLSEPSSNTQNRIISSSLDPSIAAQFAYEMKNPDKYLVGPGTIYTITWPVGTKLMLTQGSNPTSDIMEAEVRALHPRFRVCGSGLYGADSSGITTQNITVDYMRPIRTKRDIAGLEVTKYCIKRLEAY